MSEPVSLILITHNRRGYLEKTLAQLFQGEGNFELYCWDNGSTDGAADVIAGLKDPRVVWRHLCPTNVGQEGPCYWFFEHAKTTLAGKLDDDTLLPPGWIEHLRAPLEASDRFGMMGCWRFMQSDYNPQAAAHNIVEVDGYKVLWASTLAGAAFLTQSELLRKYTLRENLAWGLPLNRAQMTLDGLVSGYPLPMAFAEHMDDPRSAHCVLDDASLDSPSAPLTCRKLGFKTKEAYGAWIAADATTQLKQSIDRQMAQLRFNARTDFRARMRRRLQRLLKRK